MAKKNTVMLIIMDGFGLSEKKEYNAVAQANLKVLPKLMQIYPHSYLEASAEAVGLPHGQIGNRPPEYRCRSHCLSISYENYKGYRNGGFL